MVKYLILDNEKSHKETPHCYLEILGGDKLKETPCIKHLSKMNKQTD